MTPDFSLQAEYRHRETISGSLESNFDGFFSKSLRRNLDQDTARIGARYSLSPQTTVIASVIYTDRDNVRSFPVSNSILENRQKGTQAEAQLLYKAEPFNVIAGLGGYSLDVSRTDQTDTNSTQQIAYSYANIKIPDNVIWTVGLSYESNESLNANLNELNPKFGVQWRSPIKCRYAPLHSRPSSGHCLSSKPSSRPKWPGSIN